MFIDIRQSLLNSDPDRFAIANAYASLAFVDEYLRCRNRSTENGWNDLTDDEKRGHIISATDYIDRRWAGRFDGQKAELVDNRYQTTQFPRENVMDLDGVEIPMWNPGTYTDDNGNADTGMFLPWVLMAATAEFAVRAVEGKLWEDHESVSNRGRDTSSTTTSTVDVVPGTIKRERSESGTLVDEVEYFAPGTTTRVTNSHDQASRTSSDLFYQDPYPEADNLLRDLLDKSIGYGVGIIRGTTFV